TAAYVLAGGVTVIGFFAPRLLYGPGARGPGPLFVPVAIVSALTSAALILWLSLATRAAGGLERRRRMALALGGGFGALGGGGVVGLRVSGLGDVWPAAPLLLVSIFLAAYAVLSGERGRARELVWQGLAYALLTAALSSIGLTVLFRLVPYLAPDGGRGVL